MAISMVAAVGTPKPVSPMSQFGAGGMSQGPSKAATAPSFQALDLLPKTAAGEGPLGQMAASMLGEVQTRVSDLQSKLPESLRGAATDQVSTTKTEMTPKQTSIAPTSANGPDDKNSAVNSLNATFDHAIFMAMVNQVISGVGDTARTLVRQS